MTGMMLLIVTQTDGEGILGTEVRMKKNNLEDDGIVDLEVQTEDQGGMKGTLLEVGRETDILGRIDATRIVLMVVAEWRMIMKTGRETIEMREETAIVMGETGIVMTDQTTETVEGAMTMDVNDMYH